jgi:hypothetical protein
MLKNFDSYNLEHLQKPLIESFLGGDVHLHSLLVSLGVEHRHLPRRQLGPDGHRHHGSPLPRTHPLLIPDQVGLHR